MYDILIVGAGPAGITAGIYAKRANKRVAIIEKLVPGGQVASIGEIENYPGFASINGDELSMKFFEQANKFGIEFIFDEAVKFDLTSNIKKIECKKGIYEAKSVILAMGSASKELNIEGEKDFFGKGVSYCAMCDGNFFKGKNVAVVGSGDSSISNAIYLADLCKEVHLFTRDKLKLTAYSEEDFDKKNIIHHRGGTVTRIMGKNSVSEVEYIQDGETKRCEVDGIFVAIGRTPDTSALKGQINLNNREYIEVTDEVRTNIDGVYACGDITNEVIKQIVVAASAGAKAATEAIKYLAKNKI